MATMLHVDSPPGQPGALAGAASEYAVAVTEPTEGVPGARAGRDRFRDLAGLVCAVEALALAGFCAFYLWELTQGASDDPARVVMSAVLIAIFAVGIGLLARGWWSGANWPSTPTVVWNLLLLPVAWSLFQSDRDLVAAVVALVAATGLVGAVAADTSTEDDVVER
jgi:hypothetical protein